MRIFALTVGRNEADRYLLPMVRHMEGIVDKHFYYDDQSTDHSMYLLNEYTQVRTRFRPDIVPSFVENEGAFREAAWEAFEGDMHPEVGDWVLVIDCDEVLVSNSFLVGEENQHRSSLRAAIGRSEKIGIDLAIPEVWGYYDEYDGRPLTRHDGFWGTIHGPRLFVYMPGGSYFHGDFGVPAVPSYVMGMPWDSTDLISLMHYGYADERDQVAKYKRYTGHSGHSNKHVESILAPLMDLRTWDKPYVKEMRRGDG